MKTLNNIDLAEEIFGTLTLGGYYTMPSEQVTSIIENCKTRQDILNKVIELLEGEDTPKARYYRAESYIFSTVKYREKAIAAIKDYLQHELFDGENGDYKYCRHSSKYGRKYIEKNKRNIHIAEMYRDLGKCYEGIHDFEKATDCYTCEKNLIPFWGRPYIHLSDVLVKQNQMDEALRILTDAKKSKYYIVEEYLSDGRVFYDKDFINTIDDQIIEINAKIQNHYIYRKR